MNNSKLANTMRQFKSWGIIISILLAVAGIILVSRPIISTGYGTYFITAALCINGIYRLFRYFSIPKENRNGWLLADGILSALLGVIILIELLAKPFASTFGIIGFTTYLIGFYEMFVGITQLCSSGAVKAAGGSMGWTIFIGIVNILCSMFVISHPFIAAFASTWISGFYLIIFGIAMLIELICAPSDIA